MNSLPKTVTRQRRNYDLHPGPSVPESSTLTTRLPSHPGCCSGENYSNRVRSEQQSGGVGVRRMQRSCRMWCDNRRIWTELT